MLSGFDFAKLWIIRAVDDTFALWGANLSTAAVFLAVLLFEIRDRWKLQNQKAPYLDKIRAALKYREWTALPIFKVAFIAFLVSFAFAPYWLYLEQGLKDSEQLSSTISKLVIPKDKEIFALRERTNNIQDSLTKLQDNWLNDVWIQPLKEKSIGNQIVFSAMAPYDTKPIPIRLRLTADRDLKALVSDVKMTTEFGESVVNPRWKTSGRMLQVDFDGPSLSPTRSIEVAITSTSRFTLMSLQRWGKLSSPADKLGN